MLKPPQKIETSIHKKFILIYIEKGMNAPEIEKALLAKGAKITNPTIRKYMEYVRKQYMNQLIRKKNNGHVKVIPFVYAIPQISFGFRDQRRSDHRACPG